jgi:trans-2,3-dihydro-3-hydroxyanthranilate isomerase
LPDLVVEPDAESREGWAQDAAAVTHRLRESVLMTSVGAEIEFHIIDVFADEALTGNPLAVVPDADTLGEALMRRIAREFNQSETTFLLKPTRQEADHRLRSFTPTGDEVFGAGHNALGAWWWLAEAGRLGALSDGVGAKQEIGQSILPVDIAASGGSLIMIGLTQARPAILATHDNPSLLAAALALDVRDIAARAPQPQVVSTGAPHLLVQAASRAAVDRARPNAAALLQELKSIGAQGCYLFSLDPISATTTAYARFFNPTVGIWEDPATGSAAGPLAWHLKARGLVAPGSELTVEQGYHIGRPSRLAVHVDDDGVQLRGRCITVASGSLRL